MIRPLVLATAIAWACLSAACGSSSNEQSSSPSYRVDIVLTSDSGNLPAGRRVVFLMHDGCAAGPPVEQMFVGTVGTAGEIRIAFGHNRLDSWSSIYLDVDASGNLSPGDKVWGSNPMAITGYCLTAYGVALLFGNTTGWEDLGVQAGGIQDYTGTSRAY